MLWRAAAASECNLEHLPLHYVLTRLWSLEIRNIVIFK